MKTAGRIAPALIVLGLCGVAGPVISQPTLQSTESGITQTAPALTLSHQLALPQSSSITGGAPASTPKFPSLALSRQFAGPLAETAIQRFIDPETGVVCYLYTPYFVPNTRNEGGQVVYGANSIGTISCVSPWKK
jgi:hypothetical protein